MEKPNQIKVELDRAYKLLDMVSKRVGKASPEEYLTSAAIAEVKGILSALNRFYGAR